MESYRSGHNGAVLKTVRAQVHRGSNPLLSAMKKTLLCSVFFNEIRSFGTIEVLLRNMKYLLRKC